MDEQDMTWHALCNSKDCPSHSPEPPDPKPSYPYFCNGHGMHAFSCSGASGTSATQGTPRGTHGGPQGVVQQIPKGGYNIQGEFDIFWGNAQRPPPTQEPQ